jgi:hypothetical protein
MKTRSTSVTAAVICLAIGLPETAFAQQKQQVSFKVPDENAKFTVSQNVQVGDVPGHIVRVFEVQNRLPNNIPAINGLKPVELWNRGTADLTEGNGSSAGYFMVVMENGDKFFARTANVVQNVSGKITATAVARIIGGTGRLAGIEGTVRQVVSFDPKPGGAAGGAQFDIEYSMGK